MADLGFLLWFEASARLLLEEEISQQKAAKPEPEQQPEPAEFAKSDDH